MARKEWLKKGADGLTFGERLGDLIATSGINASQLASITKIPQSAISAYINGTINKETGEQTYRAPDCAAIIAIAECFSVSTDYLLGRTRNKTDDPVAQDVIEYTGLSEANVHALHFLKSISMENLEVLLPDNVVGVDGGSLILDCFNDIFEALMGDKKTAEAIARYYMRMRQESGHLGEYPNDEFYMGTTKDVFQGLHSERESNVIVEHSCVKIGREIEKKLKRKYMGHYLEESEE